MIPTFCPFCGERIPICVSEQDIQREALKYEPAVSLPPDFNWDQRYNTWTWPVPEMKEKIVA